MRKKFRQQKFYRLNYQIPAPKFRLLDEKGKQLGILEKIEALRLAQAEQKDLVEIAPNASPPVVKLIDFKKFKYLEAKKEREKRKNTKKVSVKEVRLSPFIGQYDLERRIAQSQEFLEKGNQLKLSLPFRGREIAHKEIGLQLMQKVLESLKDRAKIVRPPHFEGKVLIAFLSPLR